MSKLPMDLSKFKKVASDKDTSTFRHYEGHEIKVAHNKLSSKMRGQLEKMPVHQPKEKKTVEKFSDGGVSGDIPYDKLIPQEQQAEQPYGVSPAVAADASDTIETPQSAAVPSPDQPTAEASVSPPAFSLPGSLQAQIGALKGQQAGETALSTAQGGLGAAQADIAKQYQDQATQSINDQAAAIKPFEDQNAAITKDLMEHHIDPNQYVKNMSTGGKIANAIGLILGGMGSGLTHGPNLAFQYLQNQIDRDIDAQKNEIGKKNNLLTHNIQMMGNIRAGVEMTRMQQYKIVQSQLAAEAAKAQNPMAAANAQIINSQLEGKIADIGRQGAIFNMMSDPTGGGEAEFQRRTQGLRMLGNESMSKDMELKHVPGVGQASTEVPAEVRKELISRQDLHNKITDLQQFANQNSGSLNPAIIKQGSAKAKIVQDAIRTAQHQGVFKESEKDFMQGIVSDNPTQFFQKYRSGPGYQEAANANLNSLNTLKQGYGLPVREQSRAAEAPQMATMGGKQYVKVPGGWKLAQ